MNLKRYDLIFSGTPYMMDSDLKEADGGEWVQYADVDATLTANADEIRRLKALDDPQFDVTDFAHPAWWRGQEQTTAVICQKIHDILDGKDDGKGANHEPWGALRRRLLGEVDVIRRLREIEVKATRFDEANTPFEDVDPRIEVFQVEGQPYFGVRIEGNETAPFKTWREAYRAAEGHLDYLDQHAKARRLREALERIEQFSSTPVIMQIAREALTPADKEGV